MTIEHLKYGKCGLGNEFNLIKIKFKDHMWPVVHVSLSADGEISRFNLDLPPSSFQQAVLSIYVVAIFFLRLWNYQAALASSRIGEAEAVLQRD